MPLRRIQPDEARVGTTGPQAVGDLLLLLHGNRMSVLAPIASALSTWIFASPASTSPSAYSARSNQSIERLRYR